MTKYEPFLTGPRCGASAHWDFGHSFVILISSFVIALACLAAGCGKGLPTTAPVRGIVEIDGQPLTGAQYGSVVLVPEGGKLAKGKIESDGSFRLSTFGDGDGAIVGRASVAVSATVEDPSAPEGEKYQGVRWIIPRKFGSGDTSELTCQVIEGKENVFKIAISSDGSGAVKVE